MVSKTCMTVDLCPCPLPLRFRPLLGNSGTSKPTAKKPIALLYSLPAHSRHSFPRPTKDENTDPESTPFSPEVFLGHLYETNIQKNKRAYNQPTRPMCYYYFPAPAVSS